MADPLAQQDLPAGIKQAPNALDDVPSDWATVQYVAVIAPHPDYPDIPILKYVAAGSVGAPQPMLIQDESTGVLGFLLDDAGNPLYGYPE